ADQISRKLAKEGCGNMTCLASVGAHISGFVESAKRADENITIDGCSVACAKKILEHIGVTPTKSYALIYLHFIIFLNPIKTGIRASFYII
ncbi:unnamed protein product, partial [marine sediment metagenome]